MFGQMLAALISGQQVPLVRAHERIDADVVAGRLTGPVDKGPVDKGPASSPAAVIFTCLNGDVDDLGHRWPSAAKAAA